MHCIVTPPPFIVLCSCNRGGLCPLEINWNRLEFRMLSALSLRDGQCLVWLVLLSPTRLIDDSNILSCISGIFYSYKYLSQILDTIEILGHQI